MNYPATFNKTSKNSNSCQNHSHDFIVLIQYHEIESVSVNIRFFQKDFPKHFFSALNHPKINGNACSTILLLKNTHPASSDKEIKKAREGTSFSQ